MCVFVCVCVCVCVCVSIYKYICGALTECVLTDGELTDGELTDGALMDGVLTGLYPKHYLGKRSAKLGKLVVLVKI